MITQSDSKREEKDQENWEGVWLWTHVCKEGGSLWPVGIWLCSGSESSREQRPHNCRGLQPKQGNNVEKEERGESKVMVWERLRGILVEQCCSELPSQIFRGSSIVAPSTEVMLMLHCLTVSVVRWINNYKTQSSEIAKIYGNFFKKILHYHKYIWLVYVLKNHWNISVLLTFKN